MRFFIPQSIRGLGGIALVMGMVCAATAGGPGEKIQFSQTPDSMGISNLTATTSQQANANQGPSAYRRWEDAVFKPFVDSIKDNNRNFGDLPAPAAVPQPVMNEKTRAMLERRRNWAFTDLNSTASVEELLGIQKYGQPDDSMGLHPWVAGNPAKSNASGTTPMLNRNYQLDRPNFGFTNNNGMARDFMGRGLGNPAFNSLNYQTGLGGDRSQLSGDNQAAYDTSMLMANQQRDQAKQQLVEFQKMLDGNNGSTALNDTGYHPGGLKGFDALHRSSINPTLATTDPTVRALHSSVTDDPTAVALGTPNPVAKPVAPVPPSAQSIREQLDPFGAARARTKTY